MTPQKQDTDGKIEDSRVNDILDSMGFDRTPKGIPSTIEELIVFSNKLTEDLKSEITRLKEELQYAQAGNYIKLKEKIKQLKEIIDNKRL